MAAPFSHTLRSLAADRLRPSALALAAAGVLLALWAGWFFLARVAVVETTHEARLELAQRAFPVEATVAGRVVSSTLTLGRAARRGEVLVVLDSIAEELARAEEHAKAEALRAELDALSVELDVAESTGQSVATSTRASRAEVMARWREIGGAAALADEELARLEKLSRSGQVPEAEVSRARSLAQQRHAAADALRLEAQKVGRAADVDVGDRRSRLEGLRRERARVAGQLAVSRATIARLTHEIERRTLVAPTDGRIASIVTLQPGMMVREGDRLATIVPAGELKVVADFAPQQALGKIRPGQRGRLRLDGFAWTEYGSIPATVTAVDREARDGKVRVELAPTPAPGSRIPLQHGLPGALEIIVEETAPASLVVRALSEATGGP